MRKYILPVIAGIFLLVFTDWRLITMANHEYQEKIQILSVMIEEQERGADNFVTAIDILKGENYFQGTDGKEKLKSYGYLGQEENYYSLKRKKSVQQIIVLSILLFLAYLLSLRYLSRKWNIQRRQELGKLSQILSQFSSHIYENDFKEQLNERETEMERIVSQLAGLSEQLRYNEKRVMKEKEETKSLVTDISHQLKTPVSGLKMCFEILNQEDLSPEEEREFLEQCTRQLRGLEALVGALVNISRMEAGLIQIHTEPADILETLVTAVNRIYLKAEEKQIAIQFEEMEDRAAMIIPHDVKWLCEAFINILDNAVKYSPKNTEIHVCMIRMTTFLRIEIEDQGIGIPQEKYHKIFQRFYRGDEEEVRQAEGSGVGLYLTRKILEWHGGSITVSSRYGKKRHGSTFTVQVPYGIPLDGTS